MMNIEPPPVGAAVSVRITWDSQPWSHGTPLRRRHACGHAPCSPHGPLQHALTTSYWSDDLPNKLPDETVPALLMMPSMSPKGSNQLCHCALGLTFTLNSLESYRSHHHHFNTILST